MKWTTALRVAMLTAALSTAITSAPARAAAGEDQSGFTILDLVESGVKGLPACLGYCIVGVCTHLKISLFSVKIIISPRVEHNTPEFVVSTYAAARQQPWMEWREVFGPAQEAASDGMFSLISPTGNLGGYGTYQEEQRIYDRQEIYKEADIIGHPLSMLPILFANGSVSTKTPAATQQSNMIEMQDQLEQEASGEEEPSTLDTYNDAMESANDIVDTAGFPAVFLDPALLKVFSYMETANQIQDTVNTVSEALDMLQSVADLVNSPPGLGASFDVDYYMCPNSVLPFTPYYLSSNDLFGWRLGIPDRIFHAPDIVASIVPFMADRKVVGTAEGGLPGLGQGTWSVLYPRTGFVRNSHDGKVASVVAQRAIDLLLADNGEDHVGHVTLFSPGFPDQDDLKVVPYQYSASGVSGGVWQAVFPKSRYQCSNNLYQDKKFSDIAIDNSAPRGAKLRYAWTFWRRYNCCLQRKGSLIASTSIPPICLSADPIADAGGGDEVLQ